MGVPSFAAWIFKRYGKVPPLYTKIKEGGKEMNMHVDNLYIDMNGLIHPCAHPTEGKKPETEDDMIVNILNYLDRIIDSIEPQNMIYMGIDGVAPRAKMNQQRARRFSTAKESTEGIPAKEERLNMVREALQETLEGYNLSSWDHNVITPGTVFMEKVSEAVKFYVLKKINENEKWKNLKVIFSDAHYPGEGEHKLFHYIRTQTCEGLTHVIHGLDADLIMLSILSHEKKVYLMREEQFDRYSDSLNKPLHIFSIEYLIECLSEEFIGVKKNGDINNMIDDFILLCCFVGNDFLPRLPSLIINDGALDLLLQLYKKFVNEEGYITKGSLIMLNRLVLFLGKVGEIEDEIFPKKVQQTNSMTERALDKKEEEEKKKIKLPKQFKAEMIKISNDKQLMDSFISRTKEKGTKREYPTESKLYPESIARGEGDWKNDYYLFKFFNNQKVSKKEIRKLREEVVLSYIEGLIFVWKYYTVNVQSWDWYFKFHYTPLASDIIEFSDSILNRFKGFKFEYNFPFKPFDQLMSVMPKKSAHCLPISYQNEMLSNDSKLKEFYPTEFEQDLNLTDQSWKSVVLLPFIDSTKLRNITKNLKVTKEEKDRNQFKYSILYFHKDNEDLMKIFKKNEKEFKFYSFKTFEAWLKLMNSSPQVGQSIQSPVSFHENFDDISNNQCVGLFFINPCSKQDLTKHDFVSQNNKSTDHSLLNESKKKIKKKIKTKQPVVIEKEEKIETKKSVVEKKGKKRKAENDEKKKKKMKH